MTDTTGAQLALELRRELDRLKTREQEASAVGDTALAEDLRAQIASIESQLAVLTVRVDQVERQVSGGYEFQVIRDGNGLLDRVIATPLA